LEINYTTLFWNDYCFYLAATKECLVFIGANEQGKQELEIWNKKYLPNSKLVENDCALSDYKRELTSYLNGKKSMFDVPLALYGTTFQKRVWEELRKVTYGEVTTYTDIAKRIGQPKAVRAVANAIGQNPLLFIVPCHRVIRKDGNLSGFRAGVPLKRTLLQLESNGKTAH